ncbi:MAG: hypothetical protein HRU01_13530 [Myxococcales bacterium]|nr:hypothetical protein [Myxococcales bacterium]
MLPACLGSRSPLGVEVLSDDLLERPIDEVAGTTAEATQRVVEGARTHP